MPWTASILFVKRSLWKLKRSSCSCNYIHWNEYYISTSYPHIPKLTLRSSFSFSLTVFCNNALLACSLSNTREQTASWRLPSKFYLECRLLQNRVLGFQSFIDDSQYTCIQERARFEMSLPRVFLQQRLMLLCQVLGRWWNGGLKRIGERSASWTFRSSQLGIYLYSYVHV